MHADYHYIRNFLFVRRHMGQQRAERHMPEFAKRLVAMYDGDGAVSKRCAWLIADAVGHIPVAAYLSRLRWQAVSVKCCVAASQLCTASL